MEEALLWWRGKAFAICKVGDLHHVKGKLNQTGYHSILQHHAIPSGTGLVGQGFALMQDNDPEYTSKLWQRFIEWKEEQHVLHLMHWPAQSVDLYSTELVWDEFDRKVRAKQPANAAHLLQFLLEGCAELSPVFGGKNTENLGRRDIGQRGSFWWIKILRSFFGVFG